MVDFDSGIDIIPSNKAKDCYYNVKNLELKGNINKIETPFKILDGKSVNQNDLKTAGITQKMIFEQSRVPYRSDSWKRLNDIITESVENSITEFNSFFSIKNDLFNHNFTINSLVLPKNPFKVNKIKYKKEYIEIKPLKMEEYHFLLDYIHASSSAFVLVPDIRIMKDIITIEEYLKLIDESVQILSERNSKPLFVPIQIQLKAKDFDKILNHYKKKRYTNFWINFNSRHIGGSNFARVRRLLRRIDQEIGLTNTVLYYSHMKKEVNPNIKNTYSMASDAISQFMGADFIGVNEIPPGFPGDNFEVKLNEKISSGEFKDRADYFNARALNRSRIFDPNSYYYTNLEKYPYELPFDIKTLKDKNELNKLINSIIISSEVNRTNEYLKNNNNLRVYLETKRCFNENTQVLSDIIEESRQSGILNFL